MSAKYQPIVVPKINAFWVVSATMDRNKLTTFATTTSNACRGAAPHITNVLISSIAYSGATITRTAQARNAAHLVTARPQICVWAERLMVITVKWEESASISTALETNAHKRIPLSISKQ